MCDQKTWELIKAEYIAGGTSYAALAKKYGVSKASIQRKGVADGWQQLRETVRTETESAVQAHVVEAKVDRFMQLYEMADTFQARLRELMEMPLRNGREAHDLSDALNGTVALLRDLYGVPGEKDLQGRQRLDLMRRDIELKEKEARALEHEEQKTERWVIVTEEDEDGRSE